MRELRVVWALVAAAAVAVFVTYSRLPPPGTSNVAPTGLRGGASPGPVLGSIFQTGKIVSYHGNAPHPAVHHGVHHGLQGLLMVSTPLLLSRIPNRISLYLALAAAYGVGNMANDDWLEQVAERGWT